MLPKIVLPLLLLLVFVPKAFAQGIEISPAFVEVTLESPGQEKEIEITLRNTTSEPLTLELSAVDFRQADEFGKIGFVGQDSNYSYSLASFLSFPSREIEIAPHNSETIAVTVTNRQDLSPGGHYAAVVAKLVQEGEVASEESVVSPSLSSLILLRKTGGEHFNVSLTSSTWPDSTVIFSFPRLIDLLFQNEGNIHVIPYGRVEIKDMFGRLIMDGTVNPSSSRILPQSRRRLEAVLTPLEKAFPVSFMTMTINGQDSLKEASYTYQEAFVYINPWTFLVPVIAGAGYVVWRRGRKA